MRKKVKWERNSKEFKMECMKMREARFTSKYALSAKLRHSRKKRKIDAKRDAKSDCERRALTAAPLRETGESGSAVRYLENGENSEPATKTGQNGIQNH